MLVTSLSSIPPRFDAIWPTLLSLLAQRHRPDRVLLCIPRSYRRFPNWDGCVPDVPAGVEVIRCDDFGPATKLLGSLSSLAPDTNVLFCDDDRIYDPDMTTRMLVETGQHPDCAIAENGYHLDRYGFEQTEQRTPRAQRRWRITDWRFQAAYLWQDITNWPHRHALREPPRRCNKAPGYVDVFEGSGGVMVQPRMFDDAVFTIPELAFSVDDIWLSGQLERRGVPIWLPANILEQRFSEAETAEPLSGTVNNDDTNQRAVRYMQDNYGIWS